MPRVVIVTDSSACVCPPALDHPSLLAVPISILLADRVLQDLPESAATVHEALKRDELVKSSPPSAIDYLQGIEESPSDAVVVITPAEEFTVMHHNARTAATLTDRRVEVVDSRTAAAAQGLVVEVALRALDAGASASEIARAARNAAARTDLVATLPNLTTIRRSGHVPATALGRGTDEQVQPVFRFVDGAVVPEVRGARAPSSRRPDPFEVMRDVWVSGGGPSAESSVVFHESAPSQARLLADLLEVPTRTVAFSPAMAVHTGPGCVGVCWLRANAD